MIYKLFSVRDRAALMYQPPMFIPQVGQAIRAFTDEVNRADQNNQLYKHPEDFDLYYVGEYDDNTGFVTPLTPAVVAVGKDVAIKV